MVVIRRSKNPDLKYSFMIYVRTTVLSLDINTMRYIILCIRALVGQKKIMKIKNITKNCRKDGSHYILKILENKIISNLNVYKVSFLNLKGMTFRK